MHFSFSNHVNLTQRYLLLNIIAGQIEGYKRDIHVDSFDSAIVLLDDAKLPPKNELKKSLTEDFVKAAKARIIAQMEFDNKHSMTEFCTFWAGMIATGIELGEFIQMVVECTADSINELFDLADPIVASGAVILQKVAVGKGEK